jgi:hypothetical protein
MKRFISALVALIIVAAIGYLILAPPSAFNFIPFEIHESFLRDSRIKEHHFIIAFDLVFLLIVFLVLNRTVLKIIKK